MVLRMKNVNVMGVYSKVRLLRGEEGGFTKNRHIGGDCLKRGDLDCWDPNENISIENISVHHKVLIGLKDRFD